MPLVGFLPPTDQRVRSTIEAVERELLHDGFVRRYRTDKKAPTICPAQKAPSCPCSFWLADCLQLIGRRDDARQLFQRLLALRNDVGLLAEEYDPITRRQLGNFPQAFSYVALVNTAETLREI